MFYGAVKHLVKFFTQCHQPLKRRMIKVGFAKEDYVNRNRLIAGFVILAVFTSLVIIGSVILIRSWNSKPAETGQREPLAGLSYCSSRQLRPCVLSFSLDENGNMIINMLADRQATNVYLKVRQGERETIYPCEKVQGFSSSLACTGAKMPVGEAFSFVVVSTEADIALAEGTFPIIGLGIATPEVFVTPTFVPAFDRPPK